jgi:hypothetical protein
MRSKNATHTPPVKLTDRERRLKEQARAERNRRGPELFYVYRIEGMGHGETWTREFKATNPGSAFAQCLQEFPGRIFLDSWHEAGLVMEGGEEYHLAIVPAFTISCHKKQNGDAASLISQPNPSQSAAKAAGRKAVPKHLARRRRLITGSFPAVDAALTNGES